MPIIDINACFGSYPARHKSTPFEAVGAEASARGVDQSCVCSTTGIYYNDREGNLETIEACANMPQQLIPVATLNPALTINPDEAVAEIAAGPYRLVRFFPDVQGWPIDFAPFSRCLRAMAASGIPSMISCTRLGDATQIARAVCAEALNMPVVLEGVSIHLLAEAVAAMKECASILIETHALLSGEALPILRDAVGSNRIIFGSGMSALSLSAAIEYLNGSDLSDGDKTAILGGNAAQLLKIG